MHRRVEAALRRTLKSWRTVRGAQSRARRAAPDEIAIEEAHESQKRPCPLQLGNFPCLASATLQIWLSESKEEHEAALSGHGATTGREGLPKI